MLGEGRVMGAAKVKHSESKKKWKGDET